MAIGIDPGITGAIGVQYSGKMKTAVVFDIPILDSAVGKKKRSQINAGQLYNMLKPYAGKHVVYMERTHAMPKNGVIAAYSQGDSNGVIRAVCACLNMPVVQITPQTWKKYFGLGADKEKVRAKAIELFPRAELHLKKHHNRAEALLIAKYAMEQEK